MLNRKHAHWKTRSMVKYPVKNLSKKEILSLENSLTGKYAHWKIRSLENMLTGKHLMGNTHWNPYLKILTANLILQENSLNGKVARYCWKTRLLEYSIIKKTRSLIRKLARLLKNSLAYQKIRSLIRKLARLLEKLNNELFQVLFKEPINVAARDSPINSSKDLTDSSRDLMDISQKKTLKGILQRLSYGSQRQKLQ